MRRTVIIVLLCIYKKSSFSLGHMTECLQHSPDDQRGKSSNTVTKHCVKLEILPLDTSRPPTLGRKGPNLYNVGTGTPINEFPLSFCLLVCPLICRGSSSLYSTLAQIRAVKLKKKEEEAISQIHMLLCLLCVCLFFWRLIGVTCCLKLTVN